jgi:hypothetical protein
MDRPARRSVAPVLRFDCWFVPPAGVISGSRSRYSPCGGRSHAQRYEWELARIGRHDDALEVACGSAGLDASRLLQTVHRQALTCWSE